MIEQCDKYAVADIKIAEKVRFATYGKEFVFVLSWADEHTWIYTEKGPLVARDMNEVEHILKEIKEINPEIEMSISV